MALQCDHRINDPSYYDREASQTPPVFGGNLAKILGIDGKDDPAIAARLFRGMHPDHETKLTQRLDANRIGAWDWTFNLPKSVSVAELVGGDGRIGEVRTKAEQAAVRYGEKQVRVRVRKQGQLDQPGKPKTWKYPARYTDNWLWQGYRHVSARDGSPHGHTHYKIYNLSFDPIERCVKAAELRFIDREGMNEIYQKELRRGLAQLGYKTQAVGREFEIVGFPAEVKAHFSSRHARIKEIEQEWRERKGKELSSKAKGKLSLVDRPDKAPDLPLEQRKAGWLASLTLEQKQRLVRLVSRARARVRLAMTQKLSRRLKVQIIPAKEQSRGFGR